MVAIPDILNGYFLEKRDHGRTMDWLNQASEPATMHQAPRLMVWPLPRTIDRIKEVSNDKLINMHPRCFLLIKDRNHSAEEIANNASRRARRTPSCLTSTLSIGAYLIMDIRANVTAVFTRLKTGRRKLTDGPARNAERLFILL
jgi:hypothetical protein